MDINLSRPVHFAGLESGVLAAFQALISPRDGGGREGRKRSLRSMAPFATMQIIRLPNWRSLKKEKKGLYIYIYYRRAFFIERMHLLKETSNVNE